MGFMNRREYDIGITVNGRQVTKVIIDPHYELKHADSVSDQIILDLVKLLDGGCSPSKRELALMNISLLID